MQPSRILSFPGRFVFPEPLQGCRSNFNTEVHFLRFLTSMMRSCAFALLISLACLPASKSFGADVPAPSTTEQPVPAPVAPVVSKEFDPWTQPYSVLVFGGMMSTTGFGQTALFNLTAGEKPRYDNDTAGVAVYRDWFRLGYGFYMGGEVGVADRFGYYAVTGGPTIKSATMLHSGELWTGLRFRYEGVSFYGVRLSGAVTGGFSYVTDSIGRERARELDNNGNARFLFYAGPELALSLDSYPDWQLVYRQEHRSGMGGTLGKMEEGYNANVIGLRYTFRNGQ
jgi:hypothetical protein